MPSICYVPKNFSASSRAIIDKANEIIAEYQAQGYDLTVRQVYYQFVARGWLANKQTQYKRLASIIKHARLAGEIDWHSIVDRTRFLRSEQSWDSGGEIVRACAANFHFSRWDDQPNRCEVWIEKDALVGVIEAECQRLDVPFYACRGYSSHSEQWRAGRRFKDYTVAGQNVVIFHLGDHDPSGIDMTRDNQVRLDMFSNYGVEVRRLALNMDQVELYDPPPNPAKMTDSRVEGYIDAFGTDCWELDALEPRVINTLIREEIEALIDWDLWSETEGREEEVKAKLQEVADNWSDR